METRARRSSCEDECGNSEDTGKEGGREEGGREEDGREESHEENVYQADEVREAEEAW